MKPVLFVDLDRTLFDSDAFFAYVKKELVTTFGVTPELLQANEYLLSVGTVNHLRHTDFDTLLININVNKHAFFEHILADAKPDAFILPDATDFISWATSQDTFEVQILSFGQFDFQNYKIRICPSIADIPKNIIMTRKNEFIETHCRDRVGILLDDKPDQNLPSGWIEVYIDRKATSYRKPTKISETVVGITTLDDAPNTISSVIL